ncbi:MAG: type VI secretion system baseplate subunit TssK [Gemmatimonadota bacterium]|jgi:type VI secretion system protein ImpJ
MKQMQSVLWSKGVLLAPQHLQIQDRFLETLIGFRLSCLTTFPWGFGQLSIDQEALEGGVLGLAEATGIFPDGLLFDLPTSDVAPSPRPVGEHWGPDQASLTAYLAVPEERPGGRNVSDRVDTRYRSEVVMRRDENTGQSEKPVQLAQKNLKILFEGEATEGHSVLPLARMVRTGAGEYALDPAFIPPLLDIGGSEHLLALTRGWVELLSARSTTLSSMRRQRNRSLADFGVSDVANFWLLYTVNQHLPLVRHYMDGARGHPEEVFNTLLGLAGALTTFSNETTPGQLPAYDHHDLGACFAELDATVRELLETVVPSRHVSLPLTRTDRSVYEASLSEDRFLSAEHVFLAFASEGDRTELVKKVPNLLKVGSADRIDRMVNQAVSGVPLRHVASPPSALPLKLDYDYFELDRTSGEWDAIRRARTVSVYASADFPEPRMELVILLPPEAD